MHNFWHELFTESPPIELWTDSSAGLLMGLRRGVGRVRHLEVKQLLLQRSSNSKRVSINKAKGDHNVADVGAKPMTKKQLDKFKEQLGIIKVENNKEKLMEEKKGIGNLMKLITVMSMLPMVKGKENFTKDEFSIDGKVLDYSFLYWMMFMQIIICGLVLTIGVLLGWHLKGKRDGSHCKDSENLIQKGLRINREKNFFKTNGGEQLHLEKSCRSVKGRPVQGLKVCSLCIDAKLSEQHSLHID